jgi:hypothetical protein
MTDVFLIFLHFMFTYYNISSYYLYILSRHLRSISDLHLRCSQLTLIDKICLGSASGKESLRRPFALGLPHRDAYTQTQEEPQRGKGGFCWNCKRSWVVETCKAMAEMDLVLCSCSVITFVYCIIPEVMYLASINVLI